jgi:hypothetical protein
MVPPLNFLASAVFMKGIGVFPLVVGMQHKSGIELVNFPLEPAWTTLSLFAATVGFAIIYFRFKSLEFRFWNSD